MALPGRGTVVLFLGGDPALAARLAALPERTSGSLGTAVSVRRLFFPQPPTRGTRGASPTPPPQGSDTPVAFPADQVLCAQRVTDAATKAGKAVKIVDVNDPGDDREMVQRFVGESSILPIAVRFDGARLEGAEAFTGRAVRHLLAGA